MLVERLRKLYAISGKIDCPSVIGAPQGEEAKLKIDLELSSAFEAACGVRHLLFQLDEEEATVTTLLRRLCLTLGERMKPLLFEKGDESILSGLMVMINDRVVTGTSLNQADVRLRGGDRVSLMYFVSGG
jgi:sulfur carrier protein ThiS